MPVAIELATRSTTNTMDYFRSTLSRYARTTFVMGLTVLGLHVGSSADVAGELVWRSDTPVVASCARTGTADADLAVQRNGRAVAIWAQYGTTSTIEVADYQHAQARWSSPKTLYQSRFHTPEQGVQQPRLVVDRTGNGVAIWLEQATNTLYAATYDASKQNWSTPEPIRQGAGFWFSRLSLIGNAQGNVMVQWLENSDGVHAWAMRFDATKKRWGHAAQISTMRTQFAAIAVNDDGHALAAWIRVGDNGLYISEYDVARSQWAAPAYIAKAIEGSEVQLVLDHQGEATVLWSAVTPSQEPDGRLTAARLRGQTWGRAETLQTVPGTVRNPQLGADPDGNVVVVWGQSQANDAAIRARAVRYDRQAGHWLAGQILGGPPGDQLFFRLAQSASGGAVAVWAQSVAGDQVRGRAFKRAAALYNARQRRWSAVALSDSIGIETFPWAVGFDAHGRGVSLYQQLRPTTCGGPPQFQLRSAMLLTEK